LRFWQRAAVNAAGDHARTVVPAVLGALETARSEAQAYVEQGVATLDAADAGGTDPPRADWPPAPPPPDRPRGTPGQPPTAAQQAEPTQTTESRIEDLRRASTAGGEGPSTLEGPTPRLFVADLRDVPATDRT
jgi:hypothetical protein